MSIPKEQTVYRSYGKSIDELKKVQEKVPEIKVDEVLVKVKAVSLNSRDFQVVAGLYPSALAPNVIPGSDMAGEIVAVGEHALGLKVGDSVISNFKSRNVWDPEGGLDHSFGGPVDGTLQEYMAVPYEAVNKISMPKGMSWEQAASLTCTGVTSWHALFGLKQIKPGDYVVMLGTGGVSLTSLAIAKAAGAVTIMTSSSDDKIKTLKEKYGLDYGVNYAKNPDWEKEILEITKGKGVKFVVETGGNPTIEKSIDITAPGGVIALVGYMGDLANGFSSANPNIFVKALIGGVIIKGVRVGSKQHALDLINFVENKGFPLHVDKVYKFHGEKELHEAFQALASGKNFGKLAVSFD